MPETHAADASHLSEPPRAGCAYFVTEDARILRRRAELAGVLPPSLQIVDAGCVRNFAKCTYGYVAGIIPLSGGSSAKSSLFSMAGTMRPPAQRFAETKYCLSWKYSLTPPKPTPQRV